MAFEQAFQDLIEKEELENLKKIKKKEQEITKLEKEAEKKSNSEEKTKELKLEISEKKTEIENINAVNKELEKEVKNVAADLTAELRLSIKSNEKPKTYQYIHSPEVAVALNAAFIKYKRINNNIKKGILVELALREFLKMDTKDIYAKIGVKK